MEIYFLRAENGLIKIGIAKNIKQRFGVLTYENASQLKLLGVMEGNFETESNIQQQFASDKSHGEWFKPSEKLLKFIEQNTKEGIVETKKHKNKFLISRSSGLNDWEKQIVYGALLGNAFIVNPPKGLHCYLVVRQSKKQNSDTFLYKTSELKTFARQTAIYSDNHDYRWTSISHENFDTMRNFCYKNDKKHVTMDWLNTLRDVSLMIWYLDRGFCKNDMLGINTVNLKDSQEVIHRYFNEVGMPCKLEGCKILFSEKGKHEFLRVIAHRVPTCLRYRLEECNAEKNEKILLNI